MGDVLISSQSRALLSSSISKPSWSTDTGSAGTPKTIFGTFYLLNIVVIVNGIIIFLKRKINFSICSGGAILAKEKHGKESKTPSDAIKLRFEPSRFYMTKPKKEIGLISKVMSLSSNEIRGNSTSVAIPVPPLADWYAIRPCCVRLERLSDLELEKLASTRKLRQYAVNIVRDK